MRVFRRPIHAGFVLLALCAIFVAGCGRRVARVNTPVRPARIGSTETGVASWYGIPYDGRRAASGEVYDMRQLTAAHRQLPFETWVEVTNLENGKQVDVRINDRGPFVKGRILDLSQAAARDIDMLRAGTARVRLRVITPPSLTYDAATNIPPTTPVENMPTPAVAPVTTSTQPPLADPATAALMPPAGRFAVQAGAFSDPDRAESIRARLQELFREARVTSFEGRTPPLWRVTVGHDMTREQAAELAIRVRRETGSAIVVPEPEAAPAPTH